MSQSRPEIAILGAGPTGLEAALAATEKGFSVTLYEAANQIAGSVRDWGHVRLFSPWSMNASPRARRALARSDHPVPDGAECPTGNELIRQLLEPLAALPEVASSLRLATEVVAVGREGLTKSDEIGTGVRGTRRFRLLVRDAAGERIERADRVLDCTGSYALPNAVGDGGIPVPGEAELVASGALVQRIPDLATGAEGWAGRTVLLIGAGHSAQTAARDLARLAESSPATRLVWALRSTSPSFRIADDPLPERDRLTAEAERLVAGESTAVEVRCGVVVEALERDGDGVRATLRRLDGGREEVTVDRVLGLTGSVGDHRLYRQLQVHECYATSGPMKLAAALLGEAGGGADCLAQTSHGAETLVNPEPGFFILGAKSYGRNNTFLMRIGWEQVDEVLGLLA